MPDIEVKGIGRVRIQGEEPTPEEQQAIVEALRGVSPEPPSPQPEALVPQAADIAPQPVAQQATDTRPTITQLTDGLVTRPGAVAVGGTLGSVAGGFLGAGSGLLGGPAAPGTVPAGAALGTIGGGTVGAGLGSLAFDLSDQVANIATGRDAPDRGGLLGPTKKALEEAGEDLLFSGGVVALGPVFRSLKPGVGKLLGIGDEAARLAKLPAGQTLTPIQATASKPVKGVARVLGVFPFVNKPFRTSSKVTGAAVSDQFDDMLDTLAPNATIADLGVDLTQASSARFGKFRRVAGALYKRFDDLASAASTKEIIPTGDMRKAAGSISQSADAGQIVLRTGEGLSSPIADPTADFVKQLTDLPDQITIQQARQLQRDLSEAMSKGVADGFDISRLIQIKKGLEVGINSPAVDLLPKGEADQIIAALKRANGFYAEAVKPFQTTTAKRFGRVDKNIFRSKAFTSGSINQDEVFNAVLNSRSPEAITDLRKLVGPKKLAEVGRRYLASAWDASAAKAGKNAAIDLDIDGFARRAGLDNDTGRAALEEMLKGTDVAVKDLDNLLDVARAGNSITVPDVSVFLQRRLTLAGFRNIAGGLGLGAVGASNPVTTLTGVLMTRKGAQILNDPAQLRLMIKAADDTLPQMQRRALVMRIAEAVLDDNPSEEPTSQPVPPAPQVRTKINQLTPLAL